MELDKLSDELEKKLMAAETPEELSALAKENGYELKTRFWRASPEAAARPFACARA